MSITIDNNAIDDGEFDRLVASTVRDMRQSLDVTVTELAKASGVPRTAIEAIERGDGSSRAERHDLAMAMEWLSNNCLARRLTKRQHHWNSHPD